MPVKIGTGSGAVDLSTALAGGVEAQKIMVGTGTSAVEVWSALPVVTITGISGNASRDQFRAACTQYGVDYQTVQVLPFLLDTSQATIMSNMFSSCSALTTIPNLDTSQVTTMTNMFINCSSLTAVPDLDTSKATSVSGMFYGCSSLTDGNVRCIGKDPSVNTSNMIYGSGLTREPFYSAAGQPI